MVTFKNKENIMKKQRLLPFLANPPPPRSPYSCLLRTLTRLRVRLLRASSQDAYYTNHASVQPWLLTR